APPLRQISEEQTRGPSTGDADSHRSTLRAGLERNRARVQLVARSAGHVRDDMRRSSGRQLLEKRCKQPFHIARQLRRQLLYLAGCVDDQHKLATRAIRIGVEPGHRVVKPYPGECLENLGELARDEK